MATYIGPAGKGPSKRAKPTTRSLKDLAAGSTTEKETEDEEDESHEDGSDEDDD